MQKLDKLDKPERRWIVYDEHVSEVEVVSASFNLSSSKIRKSAPLVLYDEN